MSAELHGRVDKVPGGLREHTGTKPGMTAGARIDSQLQA